MSAVRGLLRAIAILLRRPDDMRRTGRVREDLWDNKPIGDGHAQDVQ